jgi:hypothetical protein
VGQKNDERFMKLTRLIGVPQREQGSPSRPYTSSDLSK